MNVMSKAQLRAAVDALCGAGNLYDTAKMILITNDVGITDHVVFADLTEPTYTGYAMSGAITWPAAMTDENGNAETLGPLVLNQCTAAPVAPELIYGGAIVDNAGAVLHWLFKFPVPVSIADVGDAVPVVPRFAMGNESLDFTPILP